MTNRTLEIESRDNLRPAVVEQLPLVTFDLTAEQLITLRVCHGTENMPLSDQRVAVTQALAAFQRGVFVLLVDDRRVTSLGERLCLGACSRVQFWRLVPLAGG